MIIPEKSKNQFTITMKHVLWICLLALLQSCKTNETAKIMSHNNLNFKVPNGIMTPETLWSFGRIGTVVLSPDKSTVVYTVTWFNIAENKGYSEIYKQRVDGGKSIQLTHTPEYNESNVIWKPGGDKIGYLSAKSGSTQIWEMNSDGTEQTIISNVDGGITGFNYSPDGSKIAYTKNVKVKPNVQDIHADLEKANARIIDGLMFRHWDEWVDGAFSHVFVADYDGSQLRNDKDIMKGEPWESPLRPHGGMEQIQWSPDSKTLAYVARKKEGKAYAISTNSDIYFYNIENGVTRNVTAENLGYDKNMVFSNNGKYMAWESQETDGYEADVKRLAIIDLDSGGVSYVQDDNLNVQSLQWNLQDTSVYFISNWHARDHIYRYDLETRHITKLTNGDFDYKSVLVSDDKLITTRQSISKPTEIYSVDLENDKVAEVSYVNKPILDQVTMGKVEERWITTTDRKQMLVWVIYPPHFDPNKKYPALLYCQGGPQGTVSQFWSYRWNFQMMAANGYIVVAPNRRGLPGFGREWNEQISGDYGGQNMKDYLTAIDAVAEEPFVDENKLGAVGASYGGYSVLYLAGHHNKRFKAFIDHDGMFNFESMYLETEETWFVNYDIGGPFWDKKNSKAQRSYRFSPHLFVDKWDTPILIIQGSKDYRVTESQGFMAFNAAQLKGVPSRLLYFPEENHWVLQAQNGILWQRTFFDWLDNYLK